MFSETPRTSKYLSQNPQMGGKTGIAPETLPANPSTLQL